MADPDSGVFPAQTTVTLPDASKRAVITGVGVIAPNGNTTDAWWKATQKGDSGIDRITHFDPDRYDTQLAGEVDGFNADDYIEKRLQVQTDRWTHMALAAAQLAFDDAASSRRPRPLDPDGDHGLELGRQRVRAEGDPGALGQGPGLRRRLPVDRLVRRHHRPDLDQARDEGALLGGRRGRGHGRLEALQHSRRIIRRGIQFAVSGGLEAPIGPYALTCQMRNGYLSREEDPADAYRPFDKRANGYVPGEGGAILFLETPEGASERGVPQVYAEIAGYGATNDAYHYGKPAPDGKQYARAMKVALEDAGVKAEDVDVVFADGIGVPEWDAIEAARSRTCSVRTSR